MAWWNGGDWGSQPIGKLCCYAGTELLHAIDTRRKIWKALKEQTTEDPAPLWKVPFLPSYSDLAGIPIEEFPAMRCLIRDAIYTIVTDDSFDDGNRETNPLSGPFGTWGRYGANSRWATFISLLGGEYPEPYYRSSPYPPRYVNRRPQHTDCWRWLKNAIDLLTYIHIQPSVSALLTFRYGWYGWTLPYQTKYQPYYQSAVSYWWRFDSTMSDYRDAVKVVSDPIFFPVDQIANAELGANYECVNSVGLPTFVAIDHLGQTHTVASPTISEFRIVRYPVTGSYGAFSIERQGSSPWPLVGKTWYQNFSTRLYCLGAVTGTYG